ncbi:MAG: QsdR family transcriptional regulator [Pseudomonadota bacterium]
MVPRRTWHTCQPIDLHRMAREYFLAAKRIELQRLARELGISRATAYRWAGSAEQLIGEVVASLIDDAFDKHIDASQSLKGAERLAFVAEGILKDLRKLSALNRYLKQNPKQGMKVLCTEESLVRARTSQRFADIIVAEQDGGHLKVEQTPDFVATALTRLIEPFLYTDTIVGDQPEPALLGELIKWSLSDTK